VYRDSVGGKRRVRTPHSTDCIRAALTSGNRELADLVATWEDAIYQCKHKLNHKDYQKALQFSTPEKFLDDLSGRAKETSKTKLWLSHLDIGMSPTVSAIFVAAMQLKAIETRILFVLFYVIIEVGEFMSPE